MKNETIDFIVASLHRSKASLEHELFENYSKLALKRNVELLKKLHDEIFQTDKTIKELISLKTWNNQSGD